MRVEATDLAAEYVVLNIWDDDHKRNLDAARWIRVAWMCRDLPRGGTDTYPVHGFPWAHVRYDLDTGGFVELPGVLKEAEELRSLVGPENYYNAFKDDHAAHLYALTQGGDAPVETLEKIAEALELKVDLRTPQTRMTEAQKLHEIYALRSTMYICDQLSAWAEAQGRKLMILLSYDVPSVMKYLETGERFDEEILEYLNRKNFLYVDGLEKAAEDYRDFSIPVVDFIDRSYVGRAGAQVFGHYKPHGNFWFAFAIREALINWLDPKPPAYQ
jgi:hypothetical protein